MKSVVVYLVCVKLMSKSIKILSVDKQIVALKMCCGDGVLLTSVAVFVIFFALLGCSQPPSHVPLGAVLGLSIDGANWRP